MRVIRGRAATVEADRAVTRSLVEDTRDTGEGAVRAWTPHRQVAFGRRDERHEGFHAARRAAEARGFPSFVRRVGGRAVAYTGTTVAFARTEPLADLRVGMDERYERALATVAEALADVGLDPERGEPPDAFCPGARSLSVRDPEGRRRKVVGLAQRVGRGVALVAGICVVADHDAVADVLTPVYRALDVPLEPATVGSVALGGGEAAPEAVAGALERALAGPDATVESLG